ncbi:hypothetical protein TUSST3_77830 [Streptomyces sp. TUS-ST3]|nr:hypothetical protein TUSST3_77830 [Streptomyces sp. TUS-ST3]
MEPTEGCTCWTSAWVFDWLMDPFFRARSETGASDAASGSTTATFGTAGASSFPVDPSGGGAGSGTAGFIR